MKRRGFLGWVLGGAAAPVAVKAAEKLSDVAKQLPKAEVETAPMVSTVSMAEYADCASTCVATAYFTEKLGDYRMVFRK